MGDSRDCRHFPTAHGRTPPGRDSRRDEYGHEADPTEVTSALLQSSVIPPGRLPPVGVTRGPRNAGRTGGHAGLSPTLCPALPSTTLETTATRELALLSRARATGHAAVRPPL